MSEIEVLGHRELARGASSPGITRFQAFDLPGALVSESHIAPGVVSAWHHHAGRTLVGRIVAGRLNFDYGPDGARSVMLSAGDFFRIPPRLVHRDVNPSDEDEAVVVALLLGEGPSLVNTSGPDAA